LDTFAGKAPYEPWQAFNAEERIQAISSATRQPETEFPFSPDEGGPPFQRSSSTGMSAATLPRTTTWFTYLKIFGYHIDDRPEAETVQSWSGWHVGDSTFIYWHRFAEGLVSAAATAWLGRATGTHDAHHGEWDCPA
jgi:hypothetical protein